MMMMSVDDEIEWENIINLDDAVDNFDFFHEALPETVSQENNVGETVETWVGNLEELLMKDDGDDNGGGGGEELLSCDYFKEFDLEVCEGFNLVGEVEDNNNNNSPVSWPSVGNEGEVNGDIRNLNDKSGDDTGDGDGDGDGDNDPLSKKRKRQLRNRDAAVRSRERKKIFVKELEMKSRYYEDECRRLERLLQWCYNENQMLRISLHTYGAAMTKPESAVLLLEPLLLGFLVWLMVNLCLLPQPKLPPLNQLIRVDAKSVESAVLRGKGTKNSRLWIPFSFARSRRCRASRAKTKFHSTLDCF